MMKINMLRSVVVAGTMLLAALIWNPQACQAQLRIEAEAFTGTPFGVGRVTISAPGDRPGLPRQRGGRLTDLADRVSKQLGNSNPAGLNLASSEMAVVERTGRVFYPVFEKRERPILQQFIPVQSAATVYFLFQGDAPLEVTVYSPQATPGKIPTVRDPAGYDRLLRAWWNDYSGAADGRGALAEYPPLVEEYLANTLSRRLGLPNANRRPPADGIFQSELNLLMGTEKARLEAARSILLSTGPSPAATLALPEELPKPRGELLNPPQRVAIEDIAKHVPVECFYARFGTFLNFLWLQRRIEEWGGELRDVVSERGLDYALNDRMQDQLGLHQGALAELLGDKVIADVALIGFDTFLSEGAAIGTLFQAKSNALLATDLNQQRTQQLSQSKNGKQEVLTIAGRQVSFFSTPDNSMRSYYVADGDFHLVTTSRALVEAFLATGAGQHESLGASQSFAMARTELPISRNDSVFVYLSPEFFQHLLGARYQIELSRRLRSAVEIELFRIARLAARGEGLRANSVAELIAAGMLPRNFGQHPDGSRLELVGDELVDTVRGKRGSFLPVPDMALDQITPQEQADYQKLANAYTTELGAIDPVMVGVQRQSHGEGLERIILDLRAAPLSEKHSQTLAQWLGPVSDVRQERLPGDVISFDAVLRGGTFFSGGDHHLFGALRDADPSLVTDPRSGIFAQLAMSQLQGLNGYLGAWPNPGFLKILAPLDSAPDAAGFSRMFGGLWHRAFQQYTLLSFNPELLAQISPQLKFVKAERPAQVWVHAEDLANSKLAPIINAYGYRQSRQIAQGNTRFLNMLIEQLHVPPAEALTTAQQLLQAKFQAPLGKYEMKEPAAGWKVWTATGLAAAGSAPPADYHFPALNWLRGVDLDLRAEAGQLAAHAELIMPVETKPAAGFQLPGILGGFKFPTPTPPTQPQSPAPSNSGPPQAK